MRTSAGVFMAMLLFSGGAFLAAGFPGRLKQEFDKKPVCATIEFDNLKIYVKDGIVRRSQESSKRVREGDRLELIEADVSLNGLDVELELVSGHTEGRRVDVEIVFERSIRGRNNELANMEDFWKAVHYFARDCGPGSAAQE